MRTLQERRMMAEPDDDQRSVMAAIVADNAVSHARFLGNWAVLTAGDLESMVDKLPGESSSLANSWLAERQIFHVVVAGNYVYPDFQFRAGRPLDGIASILRTLPPTMSGWQIGLWFVGANGWLGGRRPVDSLDDQQDLINAAGHMADDWAG
jgi:hypothetical protein